MKKQIFTIIILLIMAALSGACDRNDLFDLPGDSGLSGEKDITSFSFAALGVNASIDQGALAITATIPSGTDETNLVATFVTTGDMVHVGAAEQVSGSTGNDFSSFVVYLVTAEDSTTQSYTVTVTEATGTPYEILYEAGSGSAWFGGDSGHATGRNVGHAQSVLIDQNITLESFSFQLTGTFSPSGTDVPVRLNIIDDTDTILDTLEITLSGSFGGGWITWSGIDMSVSSGTTLVFMAYVVDGTYTNQFQNGISANMSTDEYSGGQRYMKNGTFTDAEMDDLSAYTVQSTQDLYFHLQGTVY